MTDLDGLYDAKQLIDCQRERYTLTHRVKVMDAAGKALADELDWQEKEIETLRKQLTECQKEIERLESAEVDLNPQTFLRLINTITYMKGIAERGRGYKCPDDVLPEKFLLDYVVELETFKKAEIERLEAAEKLRVGLQPLVDSCKRGKYKRDIKAAVDRFLSWKLPDDFHPDCGIDFKPLGKPHPEALWEPWPVGTNLFTAEQAKAMFEHCLDGTGYVFYPAPNQEPVAWMRPEISENGYVYDSSFRDHRTVVSCTGNKWEGWIPLYTHPAPAIPEGWQLVPKEPTDEMLKAASHTDWNEWDQQMPDEHYASLYKAILAAAPKVDV